MSSSNSLREGPCGNFVYFNALKYARAGDVLAVTSNSNETASIDTITHAMYITQVNGEFGSRTIANIKIAAHNSDTNSAYTSLASYINYPDACYARSYVDYGYYSVAQG